MNFNKDLIKHINGQTVEKVVNGAKELVGKATDELTPEKSKDISKGLIAQDSMGRASFSMLKKSSLLDLEQKFNKIVDRLGFKKDIENYDFKDLKEACSCNGTLDEELVSLAEEYVELGAKKPPEQKYVWEGYIKYLVDLSKADGGGVNKDVCDAIRILLNDDRICVRGIEDIIKNCTEWHFENGEYISKFNQQAFEKYKGLMDLNGKTMFENNDVFTLYTGRTYKGATKKDVFLRKGEEHIFDDVAFNFAKKLYEQGEDIIHMGDFLKQFHMHTKEGSTEVCNGFRFVPKSQNERWAKKMIENLKESIENKELIEECKVNGEDCLHNLLVADTLINDGNVWRCMGKYPLSELKDADGFARTDLLSYALKSGKDVKYALYDVKHCLNANGSVNGQVYRKFLNGEISLSDIDRCKIDGEINFENLRILKNIHAKQGDAKYEDYQIKDTFKLLRNKDGIVEDGIIDLVDEFKKYTHVAPNLIADCMTKERVIDKELLQFKRELCQRDLASNANALCELCKNPDGTANPEAITAIKTLLDSGFKSDFYINRLIPYFSKENKIDMKALNDFAQDFAQTDPQIRDSLMFSLIDYNTNQFSVASFNTLKKAMSNPEVAPLMRDSVNAQIVKTKFEPLKFKSKEQPLDDWTMYNFAHIKEKDIAILEKNGYPAKFYKELGTSKKCYVEVSPAAVNKFENSFLKSTKLEDRIKKVNIDAPVELSYTKEQLTTDLRKELDKLPDDIRATLESAFKIKFGEKGIEGFPQRLPLDSTPPTGMEESFKIINEHINSFYSSVYKSKNPELAEIYNEISSAVPEFRMLSGIVENGKLVDAEALKQIQTLVKSPEYQHLPNEEKAVAKMTVLLNSMEHVDSKSSKVTQRFYTDNDGIQLHIDAKWTKKGEYANSVLERFGLKDKDKYRITQMIEDIGWAKKLDAGELTPYDIAVNQRYQGDEILSPLIERIVTGECKFDREAVLNEAAKIHMNQQILFPAKLKEFEPFIETTVINGQELRYVDLSRPELKDKPILAHFLGYDNFDHTLNVVKNKAYRSAFSASLIKGGTESSQFAGRSSAIVFDVDNVNVAYASRMNIDSGFGKTYSHLKEAMKSDGSKDIKSHMRKALNLSNEEYGQLMERVVNASGDEEITDCIINGRILKKEDILKAYRDGIESILSCKCQNETTVLNPIPMAIMGVGESITDYSISHAVNLAQANDMLLLFKPVKR